MTCVLIAELVLGSLNQSELCQLAILTPDEANWAIENSDTYGKFYEEDWPESAFERRKFKDGRMYFVSKRVLARDVIAFRNDVCRFILQRPQNNYVYPVSDFGSTLSRRINREFMKMTNSVYRGFDGASLGLSPRLEITIAKSDSKERVSLHLAELGEFQRNFPSFRPEESLERPKSESEKEFAADEFDELVVLPFGWRTRSTVDMSEEILKSLYAERSELETQNSDLITQVLAQWSKANPEISWHSLRELNGTKINNLQSTYRQVFEKRFSDLAGDERIETVSRGVALELDLGGGRSLILDLGTEKNWN